MRVLINKVIIKRKNAHIYIEDKNKDVKLEERLVRLLIEKNITISTAESITGGMIGSSIVNIPGASDIFEEGYITYSDRVKHRVLKVRKETLEKYTAVSKETCEEMIVNLKNITKTDSAIAVTGYAGPGENAGLAYIGVNLFNLYSISKIILEGSRNDIRKQVCNYALNELCRIIEGI